MVVSDCPLDCGYVYVKLNSHTLQILSGLSVRSVTLTPDSLCLRYSKETAEIELEGYVGIDRNLDNVTSASTDGTVKTFDLSLPTRIKTDRIVKSQFKRNDARIRTRIFSKCGERQRNRVRALLHNVSKRIVEDAKTKRYGIVMEKLTGIRRLYQEGQRAEQKLSGQDEQLGLWRAATTDRVQSAMGRSEGNLCSC